MAFEANYDRLVSHSVLCPVCTDILYKPTFVSLALECQHILCGDCLIFYQRINPSATCPLCRHAIDKNPCRDMKTERFIRSLDLGCPDCATSSVHVSSRNSGTQYQCRDCGYDQLRKRSALEFVSMDRHYKFRIAKKLLTRLVFGALLAAIALVAYFLMFVFDGGLAKMGVLCGTANGIWCAWTFMLEDGDAKRRSPVNRCSIEISLGVAFGMVLLLAVEVSMQVQSVIIPMLITYLGSWVSAAFLGTAFWYVKPYASR